MILLVTAEGAGDEFASALSDGDWERVGPAVAAERLAEASVDLLVVDRTSVGADADALVERLRSAEAETTVPVVVVSAEGVSHLPLLRFDEVVQPPVEGALADAVSRALTVVAYRDAVADLYERCREYAADERPVAAVSDLREAREEADDLLAELVDRDPGVVADLLWMPENGGDGTRNF